MTQHDSSIQTDKNPVVNILNTYKSIVPSPLAHSLLLAGLTFPAVYYGLPLAGKLMTKGIAALQNGDVDGDDNAQTDNRPVWAKYGVPAVAALVAGGIPLWNYWDSSKRGAGVLQWNAPYKLPLRKTQSMHKAASVAMKKKADLFNAIPYQPISNLSAPYNPTQAVSLINSAPYVSTDPYSRSLATSIITAVNSNTGRPPTLGNLYDSAQNKFDTKLSLGGLVNTGVRSVVSAGLAGMFTDVVGTVLGMPDKQRQGANRLAGVGAALYSILN